MPDWQQYFLDPPVSIHRPSADANPVEVPSFISGTHYAGNFARQWAAFRRTQLDSANGTLISRNMLEQLIGHPLSWLEGKAVLEVGAGAGRFTEHLVRHAKKVVAIDLSEAILVNAALKAENLAAAQADLFHLPRMAIRFDLVFCRGVLQHTPDPVRGIGCLHDCVGPEGLVVFDIYSLGRLGRLAPRMFWRRIIPRLFTFESFGAFLGRHTGRLLALRKRLKRFLPGRSRLLLDYLLPIWDYDGILPLSGDQLIEWAQLDTLDAMFAVYDCPLSCDEVLDAIQRAGGRTVSYDRQRNWFRTRSVRSGPA